MANSSEIALIETGSEKNRNNRSATGDQFGPHPPTTLSEASLDAIKTLCKVSSEVEFAVPAFGESPESGRPGYISMYEVYFTGCGLFFPLPEVVLLFLHSLRMAFSQMTPNMLRVILAILTVAAEAGYSLSPSDLLEFCSVRSAGRGSGYYTIYPNTDRTLITGLPEKDDSWRKRWFLVKINGASITGLTDMLEVCYYEQLLYNQSSSLEAEAMKKLTSEHEKTISEQAQTIERLRKEGDDVRKNLEIERGRAEEAGKCWEERISALQSEQHAVKAENVKYKRKVTSCQEQLNDCSLKYDALLKLREHDIKEMKAKGSMLLEQVSKHLECLEARSVLRTDVNELRSNLILLGSMKKDDFNLEKEIAEVESSLAELVAELDRFVVAPFDQHQFASDFAESPSLPPELKLHLPTRSFDVSAANVLVVPPLCSDKDRVEDASAAVVEDRSTDPATTQASSRDNTV